MRECSRSYMTEEQTKRRWKDSQKQSDMNFRQSLIAVRSRIFLTASIINTAVTMMVMATYHHMTGMMMSNMRRFISSCWGTAWSILLYELMLEAEHCHYGHDACGQRAGYQTDYCPYDGHQHPVAAVADHRQQADGHGEKGARILQDGNGWREQLSRRVQVAQAGSVYENTCEERGEESRRKYRCGEGLRRCRVSSWPLSRFSWRETSLRP